MTRAMLDELRNVPLFAEAGDDVQACLAHGSDYWVEAGEWIAREGTPAESWFVLLEGEVLITKKIGDQPMVLDTYTQGTFFGEVPILIGTPYQASGQAIRRSHLFRLARGDFMHMLTTCDGITAQILRTMAWRVQNITQFSKQQEKLAALGKLSAGLAHELNNPAAASYRAAEQLRGSLDELQAHVFTLATQLAPEQITYLAEVRRELIERAANHAFVAAARDPLAENDREEAMIACLDAFGGGESWELAPIFVEAGVDARWLHEVVARLPRESAPDVIGWLAAILTTRGLIGTVEHSSGRISELVKAIKAYSYMDQAPLQEVDIHQGLETTLTILHHKIKGGVTIVRDYDRTLPRICAYGGELNQVWTNLLDNAIDAMNGNGQITITTRREPEDIEIEIRDNGPGIPPDIQRHIFEPFYTTKGIGQGTGLGLDAVYRIVVRQHKGDVRVVSQPGDTRFQVRLPIDCTDRPD